MGYYKSNDSTEYGIVEKFRLNFQFSVNGIAPPPGFYYHLYRKFFINYMSKSFKTVNGKTTDSPQELEYDWKIKYTSLWYILYGLNSGGWFTPGEDYFELSSGKGKYLYWGSHNNGVICCTERPINTINPPVNYPLGIFLGVENTRTPTVFSYIKDSDEYNLIMPYQLKVTNKHFVAFTQNKNNIIFADNSDAVIINHCLQAVKYSDISSYFISFEYTRDKFNSLDDAAANVLLTSFDIRVAPNSVNSQQTPFSYGLACVYTPNGIDWSLEGGELTVPKPGTNSKTKLEYRIMNNAALVDMTYPDNSTISPGNILFFNDYNSNVSEVRAVDSNDCYQAVSFYDGSDNKTKYAVFNYAIFGRVIAPDMLMSKIKISVKHIRDSRGFRFDDSLYPYPYPQKEKSLDFEYYIDNDGHFAFVSEKNAVPKLYAGLYSIKIKYNEYELPGEWFYNTAKYSPLLIPLELNMLGFESDQSYVSPYDGVAVNVSNGNLLVNYNDVSIPLHNYSFDVARSYNSFDITSYLNKIANDRFAAFSNRDCPAPAKALFGNGWSSPLDQILFPVFAGTGCAKGVICDTYTIFKDGDGTKHYISIDKYGDFVPSKDFKLEWIDDYNLKMTDRFKNIMKFKIFNINDNCAFLVSIKDNNNNEIKINRKTGEYWRVENIEYNSNSILTFNYTAANNNFFITIKDNADKKVKYTIDQDSYLTEVTYNEAAPDEYKVAYSYSDFNASADLKRKKLDKITAHNRSVSIDYFNDQNAYKFGRVKTITPPDNELAFDYTAHSSVYFAVSKTEVTNALNHKTLYDDISKPEFGFHNAFLYGANVKKIFDPLNNSVKLDWNEPKKLLNKITNPRSKDFSFDYNSSNLVTSTATPDGKTDITLGSDNSSDPNGEFDADKNIPSKVNLPGSAATDFKVNNGNVIKVKKTDYPRNSDGTIQSITDGNGKSSSLTYAGLGRLSEIVNPKNKKNSFAYNSAFEQVYQIPNTITKTNNQVFTIAYNENKQITSKISKNVKLGKNKTDDISVSYEYNNDGSVKKISKPERKDLEYLYNTAGRLDKITFGSRITNYIYNAIGNIINYSSSTGDSVNYTYTDNELVSQAGDVSYTYDENGNIKSDSEHRYYYDDMDRVKRVASHPMNYEYDANGNLTRENDDAGEIDVRYTYKFPDNLLIKIQDLPGRITKDYSYDNAENIISERISNAGLAQNISYTYDELNRVSVKRTDG